MLCLLSSEGKSLESCWRSNQRLLNLGTQGFEDSNTMRVSLPLRLALHELKYPIGSEPRQNIWRFML
ncbi:hypothetical protein Bca4012_076119 [Brassica carinata]